MAKQISMIKFTGKLGEMVGQKDAYGKAIIRQRVESPKNPKTTAQAGQRYKLLPAQRIASALKEIIERGQQGVKYGIESRNLFMKRALKMTTGFPYMEKDDPNIIPGEYQLTKGTLPEVSVEIVNGGFVSSLMIDSEQTTNTEVATISKAILDANAYLMEGDQITFVVFEQVTSGGVIVPTYKSIILDTSNTAEDFDEIMGSLAISWNASNQVTLDSNLEGAAAAAVIISRANGANGFLRSNATITVKKDYPAIAKYFTATGQSDALKTYEGDTSISNNTNWPVDVDGDGGASGGGGSSVERGLYTLTAADCEAGSGGPVGSQILVGTLNGVIKNIYYVVDDDVRCCCDLAGEVVMHNYGVETGTLAVTFTNLSEAFLTGKNPVAY